MNKFWKRSNIGKNVWEILSKIMTKNFRETLKNFLRK